MRTETEVLGDLWRVWGAWGADLDEERWTAPTRCAGWDVAALYAHVSQGVGGLAALVRRRRAEGPPEHGDAVALLRALKPDEHVAADLAARNADAAVADARAAGIAELVRRLAEDGPAAVALAAAEPDQTVEYFRRGTTTVRAATVVRLVEATVHLLDLAAALGREPDLPDGATEHTVRFLTGMAPPLALIEVATGRRAPDIFPVFG
ncbi:maleylpyruvate isomerase family mycothiol-dependent enzyme [Micromonospora chalcea]|uniref:maleylpyruvate isomerase family mycothiol-dependent enzyme n=1 Tax=Micromonospora chalcea TaxID=1874 RepID=UPI0033F8984A